MKQVELGHDKSPMLYGIEMRVTAANAPVMEEFLAAAEIEAAAWWGADSDATVFRIYADTAAARDAQLHTLKTRLQAWMPLSEPTSVGFRRFALKQEDWAEVWKQHFKPFRASPRLVVKPSWETFATDARDLVLEIDPGLCFGTGYHGTTRACLEFMDLLETQLGGGAFLDVGSGSGILSVAAAKLGFHPVVAFDCDAEAAAGTLKNLLHNGIADAQVVCADLARFVPQLRFRIVAANILASVLIAHAERLVGWVDTRAGASFLILAGILTSQYADVRARYEQLGCAEYRRQTINEWTSGCFVLRSA